MSSGEAWLIAVVGGAVAAVLAAGVLRLFNKTLSGRFWRALWRLLRWPLTLRITTVERQRGQASALAQAEGRLRDFNKFYTDLVEGLGVVALSGDKQLLDRVGELRDAAALAQQRATQEIAHAQAHAAQQIEATQSFAVHEAQRAQSDHQRAIEAATEEGKRLGHAAAMAEVELQRATPSPRPQWRVDEALDGDRLVLRNTQPDVVLSDISLHTPLGDFAFSGPSQWPGPSTGVVEFSGTRQGNGRAFGVKFVVRWRNERGDPAVGEAFLDRPARKAYVI